LRSFVRIARRASWNPIRQIVARYLDKRTPQSDDVGESGARGTGGLPIGFAMELLIGLRWNPLPAPYY